MNTRGFAARLGAACLGLVVFTACSGQAELDAATAGELKARVAAARQLTVQQDYPAALAELQQLGQDVTAAAEQGRMSAERKTRAESAISKIKAELEAAQAAAEPQPAPSTEPPVSGEQKEQDEDAEKEAEKQLEDARKEAEEQLEDAKKEGGKAKDTKGGG